MLELDNAAKAAKTHINELEAELDRRSKDLGEARTKTDILEGRVHELENQLAMEKMRSDHHLRWATTVTAQIYSIGMFSNEAMRVARREISSKGTIPASKTNSEVLEAMEQELSATTADLRKTNDESANPIPSFLTAGPRPLRHE